MSIWTYSERDDSRVDLTHKRECPFCESDLGKFEAPEARKENGGEQGWVHSESTSIFVCQQCGWWRVSQLISDYPTRVLQKGGYRSYAALACLKRLDLSDVTLPLDDVRSYLVAKYDSRHDVHPRLFEEVVASVFKSIGYQVDVTAYSNDGGIDVVLYDTNGQIGVQVKRYKDKIKVEQIRALAGALLLKGLTRGVFVTTSTFQPGATTAATKLEKLGYSIELLDAPRFFDALKIARRPMYQSYDEFISEHSLGELTQTDHLVAY